MLDSAERLKFRLLAEGLTISQRALARIRDTNGDRALTPADYASTSGVILELAGEVWVNAPITQYNPNFVDHSPYILDTAGDELCVLGEGLDAPARFWLPPAYHGQSGTDGVPYNNYAFTHGDRVRAAPVQGCAMTCKFCNIPYEDRYGIKPSDSIVNAVRRALTDHIQPARHVLISGGTPKARDFDYLQGVYADVVGAFPGIDVDVMMVPTPGLLDLRELHRIGIHELSINIELFNRTMARDLMRKKYEQGLDAHLDFLASASDIFGPGRVRSMLMVGLEPTEDTLAGVRAIIDRGCVPVLSPFRPDAATPLRDKRPPSASELEDVFLRATDIARSAGTALGPSCLPCTHNTLTLVSREDVTAAHRHASPALI